MKKLLFGLVLLMLLTGCATYAHKEDLMIVVQAHNNLVQQLIALKVLPTATPLVTPPGVPPTVSKK